VRALLVAAALGLAAAPAGAADLAVTITGIRNAEGDVYLALFKSPENWPEGSRAEYQERQKAVPGAVTFTLTGLAPGTYAAASFHDENGNGRFDKSFVGIPEEGWGVSNDVRPSLRAPTFGESAFTLPPQGGRLTIRLGY
jgi:uncharacterized protein (DUF2141 family)